MLIVFHHTTSLLQLAYLDIKLPTHCTNLCSAEHGGRRRNNYIYSDSLWESTNQFFFICFWHLCKQFCVSFWQKKRRLSRPYIVLQTWNRRLRDILFQQVRSSMNFAAKDSWDKCHRKIFTFELYSKKQQTEHKHKASVHPTACFRRQR